MLTAITGGTILGPHGFLSGQALLFEGNTITELVTDTDVPVGTHVVKAEGHTLLPGFIDIQVNGGGGVLFNEQPTIEGIRGIMAAHRNFGTTGMLPTLISDDLDIVAKAIRAVDDAIEANIPGILGIHIEGPFLSRQKKGAHDATKFRILDDKAVALLSSLENGITHVTLAPEETSPEMIRKLVNNGVIVSMGHTNATYEQAVTGLKAGISGFTHLFNAMTQMVGREPGVVGAALSERNSYAGIIVDGFHVNPASLKAAANAKGIDKLMLVTDAMPSVGLADKSFHIQGTKVIVKDGKCSFADGTLAGSDLDMISAVKNARDWLGLDLAGAAHMASRVPAEFLGINATHGDLGPGKRASFVVVDDQLRIQQTWIEGTAYIPSL